MKLLFAILVFCSCTSKEVKPIKTEQIKIEVTNSIDTSTKELLSLLDSSLYYKNLNDSFALEESKSEALYYRTGNEKYRKAFYRNQNKKIESARRGAIFQKKLKNL